MKGFIKLLMVLTAFSPLCLRAQGQADIIAALAATPCYVADATFSVSMPQTDTDVVYTLRLESAATPADTLSPASYLISWTLPTPSGESEGFTAYADGSLYRFRDRRLQEYHLQWDAVPFMRQGRIQPVQLSAQFADLLPQFMARELADMGADPRYTLTVTPGKRFDGHDAVELDAVMKIDGATVQERRYILDATTLMPLRTVTEANPGSITEQTVIVDYRQDTSARCEPVNEDRLMALYPEVFEKYRISNFRIENLRGNPVPQIALPTLTGERYTHHIHDPFARPTVIAVIDPEGGEFNSHLVSDLRAAADGATAPSDLILAFATTNPDKAEELGGSLRIGETMLLNARSLARDLGATALPVVVIADSSGIVRDVILGYNNNLSEIVIQSLELIR